MKTIIILPLKGCRRSKKILSYLDENNIPYSRIDLDSDEEQKIMDKHQFLSSPGFLVDGESINPYDLLNQNQCRINENNPREGFDLD